MSDAEELPPIPAPGPLNARGAVFWNTVTEEFEPDPHEAEILYAACRTLDRIAQLESEMEGRPVTVRGSHGGEVINPIITEIRMHRAALVTQLKALQLPEFPEEVAEVAKLNNHPKKPMTRSQAGSAGAAARWGRRSRGVQ